jgi:hypothetical protein
MTGYISRMRKTICVCVCVRERERERRWAKLLEKNPLGGPIPERNLKITD